MTDSPLITVGGIVESEWRIYRRSPVCLMGLLAAVGIMLNESRSHVGWPSAGMALDGFQLAVSLFAGTIVFLLAAGSLARDLDSGRNQLVFSRPLSIRVYLAGKLLAAVSFGCALVAVLLLMGMFRPLFHGVWVVYPPGPLLTVALLCGLPAIVFGGSLGLFLTAVSGGRIIVALPIFLLYFFCVALLRLGGGGDIDFADFSMRLYGRSISVGVPIHLTDVSFAHVLDPVQPGLLFRAILYTALSLCLAFTAGRLIARRRVSSQQSAATHSSGSAAKTTKGRKNEARDPPAK